VICEIMNDDGTMARLPDLVAFAQRHGLKIGTISRPDRLSPPPRQPGARATPRSASKASWRRLDDARLHRRDAGRRAYRAVKGDLSTGEPVLVRMHALDPLEDVWASAARPRRADSATRCADHRRGGRGVLVLLRDARGMKLVMARRLAQTLRQYGLGAQILLLAGSPS
jgi:3,4-dihydroxy 2-butanone 4-phosphate synthase/GTP cyclohydrolase II